MEPTDRKFRGPPRFAKPIATIAMNTTPQPSEPARLPKRSESRVSTWTQLLLILMTLWPVALRAQVAGAIVVYPNPSSIEIGTTLQFTGYVPISPNTVTWFVNDIPGGDATVGTISGTGFYQAPASAPAANVVTVKAKSTAFPNSFGTASLTITRKYPWLWSASPSKLPTGNYVVSFNGANFAPDSQALANGVPVTTTFVSSTQIKASGNAAVAGTLIFSVKQPGNGAVIGNTVSVPVSVPTITVTVAPSSASVPLTTSKSFVATVAGTANSGVTWSVNGISGGNSTVGTINASGLYAAPASMPSPSSVTVQAFSVANPAISGQATVTLAPPPPPVVVTVAPANATVQLNGTQTFTSTVSGSANTAVTWSVNGINGGSATVGTITSGGVYTAPAVLPSPSTVTVRATSVANPNSSASAAVALVPPPPPITVAVSPATASVSLGSTLSLSATVTGSPNTSVVWSVNGVNGGSPSLGTISAAGLYTPPVTMPANNVVTVRATSAASAVAFANATLTLTAPPFPAVWLTGARFLDQSSFGPTPATLAHVQQIGIQAYLDEQFSLPETAIPVPADNNMGTVRQWALYNYTTAPDQLRQRVAFALSQIIVTSGAKLIYANEILPWMRILSHDAFGNYRTMLREVSLSPSMGKYLDLANSMRPGLAGGANENYARELMQLFTIGLWQLNQDGSQKLDGMGNPIPTYDQNTVHQVALALTGWTYGTAPGATPQANNWEYFGAPMEPRPNNHDNGPKSYLGVNVPAGLTVDQDLDTLLDTLFTHPNAAPFLATRLIRSLVTSNPSPGFISRIASVFDDNGSGVRGDLAAVVRAILLDPEARDDSAPASQGRLKDAIVQTCGFLRAFNGSFAPNQGLTYLYDYMAQSILTPPSVFSWFSPLYHVPKSAMFGPEFQIYSPTEAVLRGNFMFEALHYPATDMIVDLTPFQAYGNDMPGLVEAVNQTLLYGRMPAAMKTVLINAAAPGYDAATRIETVLYLTALSGQYAVQY